EEVGLSLDIYKKLPPKYVRIVSGKTQEGVQQKLGVKLTQVKGLKDVFVSSDPQVGDCGDMCHVQDLSSFVPVFSLEVRKKDSLLDLCAAPGLKSALAYDLVGGELELTCVDSSRKRYTKMLKYFKLHGIQANTYHMDGRRFRSGQFDKVLVDVPCSGEGVVSKFTDVSHESNSRVKRRVKVQYGLLKRGFDLLKPGGLLVYSTCTLNKYENEGVVSRFLKKHPDAVLDLPEIRLDLDVKQSEFGIRIIPGKTRGAFVSRVRKVPRQAK
ncbi:MAG: RsmB/NOP family class I SAM-dependent RNA methyltransferase, partial [Nanoarchaeota archaeon]|nr:RsmB/NOP family class I SAM-dependent RNA methyltransferase [Nanoarchaeota archaeon]